LKGSICRLTKSAISTRYTYGCMKKWHLRRRLCPGLHLWERGARRAQTNSWFERVLAINGQPFHIRIREGLPTTADHSRVECKVPSANVRLAGYTHNWLPRYRDCLCSACNERANAVPDPIRRPVSHISRERWSRRTSLSKLAGWPSAVLGHLVAGRRNYVALLRRHRALGSRHWRVRA
jgi:hypothetical protein